MSDVDAPSPASELPPQTEPQPPRLTPAQRKRRRILAIIGSIAALLLGIAGSLIILLYVAPPTPSDGEMIVRILSMANLDALPDQAQNVETGGDNSLFQMTLLLRFEAPATQIQAFLDNSPGLRGVATEVLNPRHMFLPFPPDGRGDPAHRHYLPDPRQPWWNPHVQTRGRLFEIDRDSDGVSTQLIVNDEANRVFIKVERGGE